MSDVSTPHQHTAGPYRKKLVILGVAVLVVGLAGWAVGAGTGDADTSEQTAPTIVRITPASGKESVGAITPATALPSLRQPKPAPNPKQTPAAAAPALPVIKPPRDYPITPPAVEQQPGRATPDPVAPQQSAPSGGSFSVVGET